MGSKICKWRKNLETIEKHKLPFLWLRRSLANGKGSNLRSVQSFLALRVDEVACRLLLAQVRCIFLTFSICGQLWTTTTTIYLRLLRMFAPRGNSALSVLLIDRRLAYSPMGTGAVLRSLLRKSSLYLPGTETTSLLILDQAIARKKHDPSLSVCLSVCLFTSVCVCVRGCVSLGSSNASKKCTTWPTYLLCTEWCLPDVIASKSTSATSAPESLSFLLRQP
jgi:hypothetical protein